MVPKQIPLQQALDDGLGAGTVRAPVFGTLNSAISNFSKLICQNCDGSIKILLDVGNQQHAV